MLVVQIVTGVILAMHYTPNVALAFDSVEHIKRDVNGGRIIQAVHSVGASMFFAAVYIHIFRGMYFGSYKAPREILWILGVLIFLLMMATAFMGYVLPWGQMSFWAATVITNIFGAIPGDRHADPGIAARRFLGGQSDAQPLLLAALPAAIRDRRGRRAAYLGAARAGQQQSDRRRREGSSRDTVPFHPYYTMKDLFGDRAVRHPLRLVRVLCARYPGSPRQLRHGQQPGDAGPYRARMVLPAVLRHPARHRLQHPVHQLASWAA